MSCPTVKENLDFKIFLEVTFTIVSIWSYIITYFAASLLNESVLNFHQVHNLLFGRYKVDNYFVVSNVNISIQILIILMFNANLRHFTMHSL